MQGFTLHTYMHVQGPVHVLTREGRADKTDPMTCFRQHDPPSRCVLLHQSTGSLTARPPAYLSYLSSLLYLVLYNTLAGCRGRGRPYFPVFLFFLVAVEAHAYDVHGEARG